MVAFQSLIVFGLPLIVAANPLVRLPTVPGFRVTTNRYKGHQE
jgi:hypothetical protein